MRLFQWNCARYRFLAMAEREEEARAVLVRHLNEHGGFFAPEQLCEYLEMLNGPATKVMEPWEPVVIVAALEPSVARPL